MPLHLDKFILLVVVTNIINYYNNACVHRSIESDCKTANRGDMCVVALHLLSILIQVLVSHMC